MNWGRILGTALAVGMALIVYGGLAVAGIIAFNWAFVH